MSKQSGRSAREVRRAACGRARGRESGRAASVRVEGQGLSRPLPVPFTIIAPSVEDTLKRRRRLATEATAYHEAGHAVAAHVLGHRIKRMTIVPSKLENYKGCVYFAKQPNVKGIDRDPSPRITRAAQERILTLLAGLCAQRIFNPRTCRSFHGYNDYKEVLLYVGHLIRENETEPFLKWMEVRTENILRDEWKAVEVLAEELIRRHEIGGEEAHRIIQNSPFEPKWD